MWRNEKPLTLASKAESAGKKKNELYHITYVYSFIKVYYAY